MTGESPCWFWCGPLHDEGYGLIHRGPKSFRAHRLVYEFVYGDIHPGLEVHHNCEVKNCCNPEHLEAMTKSEHNQRHSGRLPHEPKTHCKHGHEFTPENTRFGTHKTATGFRKFKVCKVCDGSKSKRRKQKAKS